MKILKPILTSQTISIQPRISEGVSEVSIYIRKDGEGVSETVTSSNCALNGNFLEVTFQSSILTEGETYSFKVTNDSNLMYRGKIYATTQDDFKVKHKQSQENYIQYNEVDDNTYIIK